MSVKKTMHTACRFITCPLPNIGISESLPYTLPQEAAKLSLMEYHGAELKKIELEKHPFNAHR